MKKKMISLSFCLLLTACGNEGKNSQSSSQAQDTLPLEGRYRAILRPLNHPLARIVSGQAQFTVKSDNLKASIYLDDAPKAKHIQVIRDGGRCPLGEDPNQDGYLDGAETEQTGGDLLVTLDQDGNFPNGSTYHYKGLKKVSSIEEGLAQKNKILRIAQKIVLIYGIANSQELPSSVSGFENHSPQDSFPIACGVIERMVEDL
jgi:hypothetical protein